MPRKWFTWVCLLLIVAVSWMDNQFFNEAVNVSETKRKLFHILFLALVMGIGYLPIARGGIKWARQLWIIGYSFVFLLVFATGALHLVFHIFSPGFMDEIYLVRVSFCSPLPFMVIYVLSTLKGMMTQTSK